MWRRFCRWREIDDFATWYCKNSSRTFDSMLVLAIPTSFHHRTSLQSAYTRPNFNLWMLCLGISPYIGSDGWYIRGSWGRAPPKF